MQAELQRMMQASDVTGMAIGVIENGVIDQIYTLGQIDGQPIQAATTWRVASLTKPVLVYGVLQLVKNGVLDMDRPLQDYLAAPYLVDEPLLDRITARQTMMHTCGFPNWRGDSGLRVQFEPGTRFSYSSEGLTYLQHVSESVIDASMRDYLRTHVFASLDMNDSDLALETLTDLPPMLHFLSGSLLANGALSLRTTIGDYTRFMLTVCSGQQEDMLKHQVRVGDITNLYWGLGWGLQMTALGLSCWHWGARSIPKTMNFALALPAERRAIVVFTNHANGLHLCRDIIIHWLGESSLPAFEWLLPAQLWRPDGKAGDGQRK
jgi:CubicO group peptidase (beta-lactamase class C family)